MTTEGRKEGRREEKEREEGKDRKRGKKGKQEMEDRTKRKAKIIFFDTVQHAIMKTTA